MRSTFVLLLEVRTGSTVIDAFLVSRSFFSSLPSLFLRHGRHGRHAARGVLYPSSPSKHYSTVDDLFPHLTKCHIPQRTKIAYSNVCTYLQYSTAVQKSIKK